jgi:hypothetical protein
MWSEDRREEVSSTCNDERNKKTVKIMDLSSDQKEFLKTPINKQNVGSRAYYVLKCVDVVTMYQLVVYKDIASLRNIGAKTIKALQKLVKENGFSLGQSLPPLDEMIEIQLQYLVELQVKLLEDDSVLIHRDDECLKISGLSPEKMKMLIKELIIKNQSYIAQTDKLEIFF